MDDVGLPARLGLLGVGAGTGALVGATATNILNMYLKQRKQAKEENQKRIFREVLKEKNKGK